MIQSRNNPIPLDLIRNFQPVGIVQATCIGMHDNDPIPFPHVFETIKSSIQWGVEWIYKEDTAFAKWIYSNECRLVSGITLFELQAIKQSDIFLETV